MRRQVGQRRGGWQPVVTTRHHAPAPRAPAAGFASDFSAEDPAGRALLLPLGHALADTHHAHELALDNAADAFNLVARVPGSQEQRGRGTLPSGLVLDVLNGVRVVG